jgi:sterol desaturase/sphingolipid hydroxylase (fatty acid hydroxylase superfamily)
MANQFADPHMLPKEPRAETCRMFESDFLERFSRIHPSTPFIAWLPIVGVCLVRSFLRHDLAPAAILAIAVGGTFTWTLAEYVLHRYVFHWTNDKPWGKRIHFLLHGVHHDYPNDRDRLVMPLLTSVPLALVFYALFVGTMGRAIGEPAFAGFVVGYLFYDGTHYYVHHFMPKGRWGRFLKRHHMTHHYMDHDGGFGVSTPLWDIVLGTLPKKKTSKAQ